MSIQLGDLKITIVNDGLYGFDGGAMFSVVPRALWGRKKPPDELNRVTMTTNCLLVERGSDLLLIDTGLGDKIDARSREQMRLADDAVRLPAAIRAAGYELEDVTHVLLTHLHFDHCGWNTREVDGKVVPTFSKARYFLQRGEVEHARAPNLRDRSSYNPLNWEPLFEAGVGELFDNEIEVIPGVRAVRTPGHNADMCIVLLDGTGEGTQGALWADLVPTAAHLPIAWVMSYDLYPLETMANKEKWLGRAVEGDWLSFFIHDPEMPVARLREEKPGRYTAIPVSL